MPKTIRMDNAGENVKLQQVAEGRDWKLGLNYEFTAPHTPQQNALAEVAFPTIMNRANAMCEAGNVPEEFMHLLKPKAIMMATELDGLQPVRREGILATKYIRMERIQLGHINCAHHLKQEQSPSTPRLGTKVSEKESPVFLLAISMIILETAIRCGTQSPREFTKPEMLSSSTRCSLLPNIQGLLLHFHFQIQQSMKLAQLNLTLMKPGNQLFHPSLSQLNPQLNLNNLNPTNLNLMNLNLMKTETQPPLKKKLLMQDQLALGVQSLVCK